MLPSRIRVLSDQTINKIAAGEVIENPASVVKELVENALDAGATSICVEIQEGGRQLIRITDNGCGMARDDALLCLERHATSKIREVEDIQDLLTMGFRGEAIPSIAAISKFTLLTCPRTEEQAKTKAGTFLNIEGGRLLSCAEAARDPGTTIEVKSLFFNVPVRRKFQRSPQFDSQEILKMLGLLALGYPAIQFELIGDQKSLLKTQAGGQTLAFHDLLGKRVESVLGKDYAHSLLPVKFQQAPYEIEGFIGSASSHRPNRTGQHLFINQRAISSPLIATAVREGYGTMLPTQRYPVFVLHLRLPGTLLDVNVHPQKREVRLRQEHELKEMVIQAIQTALRHAQGNNLKEPPLQEDSTLTPPFWGPYASLLSPSSKAPFSSEETWEFKPNVSLSTPSDQPFSTPRCQPASCPAPQQEQETTSLLTLNPSSLPTAPQVSATLLGYIILDPFHLPSSLFGQVGEYREGGLPLIDQRAAYARVYYEQLLKKTDKKESQSLLIPLTVQLSVAEASIIREHLALLQQMGFELRELSQNTFVVDAFPSFLKQAHLQTCISLLLQDLIEAQTSRRLQALKEEQLALMACRASLPTTKRLSLEEAQGLVQQLMHCALPTQCPLGKPTCLYLAPDEVAKWFQK